MQGVAIVNATEFHQTEFDYQDERTSGPHCHFEVTWSWFSNIKNFDLKIFNFILFSSEKVAMSRNFVSFTFNILITIHLFLKWSISRFVCNADSSLLAGG